MIVRPTEERVCVPTLKGCISSDRSLAADSDEANLEAVIRRYSSRRLCEAGRNVKVNSALICVTCRADHSR